VKVILLAPTPPPAGGIASWTVRMQNASLKNGWKVEVVDEKVIGNRDVFGDKTRMKISTETKRTFGIWKDLYNKLKDKEVKVVHSNIPAGINSMIRELVCLYITKLLKRKFIIHYRCTIPNLINGKLSFLLFRLLTGGSDAVIALNTPSKNYVIEHTKTPVYMIPNFVEDSAIEKSEFTVNKELKRAIYVGGVIAQKGCLEIIEASKNFPNIEFRLIGKASKEVKKSVGNNNVVLLGEQEKEVVIKEITEADVFLFPSYFAGEGFSNALVEAMAMGLPCIASDWAANRDMLENKGGIIIPKKDKEALVDAIERLHDFNTRLSMSSWNIQKVKGNYIESIVTNQYVDLYEEITIKENN
jgi:glycosyltransferase involved in cell wall biosynthesis